MRHKLSGKIATIGGLAVAAVVFMTTIAAAGGAASEDVWSSFYTKTCLGPTTSKCAANQLRAVAEKVKAKLKCWERVLKRGLSPSETEGGPLDVCLDEAEADFATDESKAEALGDCLKTGIQSSLETSVTDFVACIVVCVEAANSCLCSP